jgi:transposase-like protein
MPPRRSGASGASLDVLREAVARRVADTSVRQTAREIGLSHQALSRFIRAETEPYGTTVAKIRAWYAGEANELERLRQEVAELKRELAECRKRLGKR